jgi:tRNA threonylcarbamoyladenosine biosynthesis protein TsaE
MRHSLRVHSAEHMREIGAAVGQAALAGDRFFLEGPFGAGKTTFVQGLARGLEVDAPVSSPSFVIETQYGGRVRLYHVDLYRLERIEAELLEALEEHLFGDGVTAVEWAERLPPELQSDATRLIFEMDGDDARRLTLLTRENRLRAAFGE